MERFIQDDFLVFPRPGVIAGRDCQISLLGVVVIYFEEEIPGLALFEFSLRIGSRCVSEIDM